MAIKCIVCDLDETLLNDEDSIDAQTTDFLIKAQENGILLILASGRSYKRMMKFAEQLQMKKHEGLLIDVNGTSIIDLKNDSRYRISALIKDNIKEIFAAFKDENVEIQFNLDDTIYVYLPEKIYELKNKIRTEMRLPKDYPWTGGSFGWLADMRDGYPYSSLIKNLDEIPVTINKMTLNQEKRYINDIADRIKEKNTLAKYTMVKTSDRTLEIMREGVSKGNALRKIMDDKQLKEEEVVVFGNAENDISMFALTKNTYAVANASADVKQHASYITDSNNEQGVYKALLKILSL